MILSIIFGLIINQFMRECRVLKGVCDVLEEANQLKYRAFQIKAAGTANQLGWASKPQAVVRTIYQLYFLSRKNNY
jgi:hypothetical protein